MQERHAGQRLREKVIQRDVEEAIGMYTTERDYVTSQLTGARAVAAGVERQLSALKTKCTHALPRYAAEKAKLSRIQGQQ